MQVTLSKLANDYREFNINEYVYVKLTDKGMKILEQRRKELNNKLIARGIEPIIDNIVEIDKDGYSKFQLWNLMEIFGPYMKISLEQPFETTIRFNNTYK